MYKQCYVAFLDILGFKELINTKSLDEIKEVFVNIITDGQAKIALSRAAGDEDKELLQYNKSLNEAFIRIMSDSIVVAVPDKYPQSLAVIIDICRIIQEILYGLENPILLRGAIAKGEFFYDESIMIGKGMVDAYLAQEMYSIYPRIIIADQLIEEAEWTIDHKYENLPRDKDEYYYIDNIRVYLDASVEDYMNEDSRFWQNYHKLQKLIDDNLKGYKEQRLREKYIWLRNEIERCISEERVILIQE